jgi:hypothetical protein
MMKPQVEIVETPNGSTLRLKVEGKTYEWKELSPFGVGLLKALIQQKFPNAVFLHKTVPAMGDYGENSHSGEAK